MTAKPLTVPNEAPNILGVGDRAEIFLDSKVWQSAGWFEGTVIRVDRYSANRSFYWVKLDVVVEPAHGERTTLVSVLNPRHIRKP